jgi:hypothetical protein
LTFDATIKLNEDIFDATIKLNEDKVEACSSDANSRACLRGDNMRDARLALNDEN